MAVRLPLDVILGVVDKATRPLSRVQNKLGKFGTTFRDAGRKMTRSATVPILALGALTASTAANYEFAMNRVRALTGATGQDFAKLSDQAKALGASTVFSAQQAAEAQGNLALAGFRTNEIFAATPGVLSAAAATNTELGETATIVSKTLRGYSLAATESGRVADVLATASTRANQQLADLGESMKFAGPVAAGFNLEFEETVALASRFADAGFEGTLGGTALRNSILELAKIVRSPQSRQFQTLERLGIDPRSLFDAEGHVRDLLGLIDSFRGAGATGLDLGEIFGKRTIGPLIRLAGEGSEGVRELADELRNSAGESARLAEIMNSGAFGAMQRFKAASEAVMIAIGESGFLEVLTKNIDAMAEWLKGVSETNPAVLALAVKIAGVTAVAGPLLLVIGQGTLAIRGLLAGVQFLVPLLVKVGAVLWNAVIPAVWGFTVALLSNPLTWIVAGVAAVLAALAAFAFDLGGIRTKVLALFSDLWAGLHAVGEAIWGFLSNIPARIVDAIGSAFSWIREKVSALVSWLPDWIVGASEGELSVQVERTGAAGTPEPAFAAAPAAGAGARGAPARVVVDFSELPRGARVRSDSGDAELEVGVGFAHDGPLG